MKRLLVAALALLAPSFAQAQTTFANQPNVLQPLGATDFALVSQLVNGRNVTGKTTLGALWAGFQISAGAIATALGFTPQPALGFTPANKAGDTFTGNVNLSSGLSYQINGTTVINGTGGHVLAKLAVASLPTCNAGAEGTLYAVTDANSTTFNAAVAAGGANHVMAFCNGTGWTVH